MDYLNDFEIPENDFWSPPFEKKAFEDYPGTIFCLDENLTICYVNKGWTRFATENGGAESVLKNFSLGSNFADAIKGELKEPMVEKFKLCLTEKKPWIHDYECSSETQYRLMRQFVYPAYQNTRLIVVNVLSIEAPIGEVKSQPWNPDQELYLMNSGFFTQCTNCRCTQRNDNSNQWDWVPQYVHQMPPNTSHSICPVCFELFWKNPGI